MFGMFGSVQVGGRIGTRCEILGDSVRSNPIIVVLSIQHASARHHHMSSQGQACAHLADDDSGAGMQRAYSVSSTVRDGSAAAARADEDGAQGAMRLGAPMGPETVGRLLSTYRANIAAVEVHLITVFKTAEEARTVLAPTWRGEQARRSGLAAQLATDCSHLQMLIMNLSQSIADMT